MKLRILAGAALAMAVSAAGTADAQPGGKLAGVREACRADVMQLCGDVEPGGGRLMQCLRQHLDRVSNACKSALPDPKDGPRGRKTQPPSDQAPANPG